MVEQVEREPEEPRLELHPAILLVIPRCLVVRSELVAPCGTGTGHEALGVEGWGEGAGGAGELLVERVEGRDCSLLLDCPVGLQFLLARFARGWNLRGWMG